MAPPIANDLQSPVSLLWAHQLRREHATVVEELQSLKQLQPLVATVNRLVEQVEEQEPELAKVRQELDDISDVNERAMEAVHDLKMEFENEKIRSKIEIDAQDERHRALCSVIGRLNLFLERQQRDIEENGDLRKEIGQFRQELEREKKIKAQEANSNILEVSELKAMLEALDKRIDGAVVAVFDGIDQERYAKQGLSHESREVDPTDLDRNVSSAQTILDSGIASLDMSAERPHRDISKPEPTMDQPEKGSGVRTEKEPAPRRPVDRDPTAILTSANPIHLKQGKEGLTKYLLTANAQRQVLPVEREAEFVNAFRKGLHAKADKQKVRNKTIGNKTWEKVLDCFPKASQPVRRLMEQNEGSAEPCTKDATDEKAGPALETRGPRRCAAGDLVANTSVSKLNRNDIDGDGAQASQETAEVTKDEANSQKGSASASVQQPMSYPDYPNPRPAPVAGKGRVLPIPETSNTAARRPDFAEWVREMVCSAVRRDSRWDDSIVLEQGNNPEWIPETVRECVLKRRLDLSMAVPGGKWQAKNRTEHIPDAGSAEQHGKKRKFEDQLEDPASTKGVREAKRSKTGLGLVETAKGPHCQKGKGKAGAQREDTPSAAPVVVISDDEGNEVV